MALANCGIQKIETFLSDGPFYIPNYQRDYSWEVDQEIKDFWDDLKSVLEENLDEFFLGQIVIHNNKEENKKYLIDGQQRTTTLMIFFVALRNLLRELKKSSIDQCSDEELKDNFDETERDISSLLAINKKSRNKDKLFLGDEYKEFFRDSVLYAKHDDIYSNKNRYITKRKIISCYKSFYDYLLDYIENKSLDIQYDILDQICTCVTSRFKVLYVETDDESEAFLIFETLNARGRDLETSDLLKNYFFRRSYGNIEKVKNNWQSMVQELSGENITNYIRCLWNSQHEFCREKLLYKKISKEINTPSKCLKISNLLKDYSKLYLNLLSPYNCHFFSPSNERENFENILCDLCDLKIKTFYSVVLSYYDQHKQEDEKKILIELTSIVKCIEKIIIRDIVISKRSPAQYEMIFARLSTKIYDNELITLEEIKNYIKSYSVTDLEFENNFKQYSDKDTASGKNKIRYLLRNIINYQSKEVVIKRNNDEVHIEHIMPQAIGKWNITQEQHDAFLWRLGNLILLDSTLNIEMQNDVFSNKTKFYLNSSIQMNKDIANNYDEWGPKQIEKRQAGLYEIAKKLWFF